MNKHQPIRIVLLLIVHLAMTLGARCADNDRPPTPMPRPAGGGGGGQFGAWQWGARDFVIEFATTLGELNLTPEFNLTREQKEKFQAAREEFRAQQVKWRTDHADELAKIQQKMMTLFQRGGGGPANAEAFQAVNTARQELLSSAPDSGAAVERMMAILTAPQRTQFEAWRDDPARQPQGFGGFGGGVTAPKGTTLPSDSIAKEPGFYRLKFQTEVQLPGGPKRVSMAYVLYLPAGYTPTGEAFPVLVFLHGAGETGTDGNAIFSNGPAMELQRQGPTSPLAKKFPFVMICPQCPPRGERWDQPVMLKAVLALLDDVQKKIRTDPARVYVTGLSMGGKGTWLLSMEAPERFAAIAPIAADTLNTEGAAHLKSIATWAIVGAEDFGGAPEANQKMTAAIRAAGGDAKVTVVPGEGHFVWPKYYADPTFYDWFLTHKLAGETKRSDGK